MNTKFQSITRAFERMIGVFLLPAWTKETIGKFHVSFIRK
jgi:hypothetical protein